MLWNKYVGKSKRLRKLESENALLKRQLEFESKWNAYFEIALNKIYSLDEPAQQEKTSETNPQKIVTDVLEAYDVDRKQFNRRNYVG